MCEAEVKYFKKLKLEFVGTGTIADLVDEFIIIKFINMRNDYSQTG